MVLDDIDWRRVNCALAQVRHGLDPEQPTSDGAIFARAALRTWPK